MWLGRTIYDRYCALVTWSGADKKKVKIHQISDLFVSIIHPRIIRGQVRYPLKFPSGACFSFTASVIAGLDEMWKLSD